MGAILKLDRLLADHPHIGFVNQRRALQCVVGAFRLEMVMSQTAKLVVDQGQEILEGFFVALFPVLQKLGRLTAGVVGHLNCRPLVECT